MKGDFGAYALNRPQYRVVGLQRFRELGERIKRGAAIAERSIQYRKRRFLFCQGTVHKNLINFYIFAYDIEVLH